MRDDAPRLGRHAAGLAGAAVVLALVTTGLLLALVPVRPAWWVARTTLAGQSLLLAVAALVLALAAAVTAVRSAGRPRAAWGVVGALAVAATGVGAVPAVAQARLAAREGVPVDWSAYLDGSAASPARGPDLTTTYATPAGASLEADLYLPPAGGARPGVVLVHGGAWTSGTRSALPRWDAELAGAGAVVMDVEYRLSGPDLWRAQPADVACAVGWLAARAARFGVDPARISVVGQSAGGQAALVAGWSPDVAPSCDVPRVRPWRVVAIAAPTDLGALDRTRTPSRVAAFGDVRALTGGPPSAVPRAFAAASPLTFAGRRGPATLLVHGAADEVVPVSQSRAFAAAARAAGGDVRLVEVPFAGHAFDLAWGAPGTQVTRALVREFVAGPL